MPKYRNLHVKIIDSFDFNEMPDDFTRVTWMLLTLVVDSEGRGIDNPAWIKAKIYPLRPDVSAQELKRVFDWLADKEMIVRYTVAGRNYFYLPTFKNYQSHLEREARSLLPSPPDNSRPTHELLTTSSTASVYVIEDVIEVEDVLNTPQPPENEDDENGVRQLSKQFEASTSMIAHNLDRWDSALQEMFHAGVRPDDLAHVIHVMKCPPKGGKKLTVAGPWSCVNMAIAYSCDRSAGGSLGIDRSQYE